MKPKYTTGIFNDVIGPIMRGPSSSHTAAAHRIGSMIKQAARPGFTKVVVKFDKEGALPTTYIGQGSAMGFAGGLLGIEITDPQIINYHKILKESSFDIEYIITDIDNKHPNAYKISVHYPNSEVLNLLAISLGGGVFDIVEWEGFKVSLKGNYFETIFIFRRTNSKTTAEVKNILNNKLSNIKLIEATNKNQDLLINIKSNSSLGTDIEDIDALKNVEYRKYDFMPVMPAANKLETKLPFTSIYEMLKLASEKSLSLWELAVSYEKAVTGLNEEAILKMMEEIVLIVKKSIDEGLAGTKYSDRILGTQSVLIEKAIEKGRIKKTVNSTIISYTSAIMEVKSSMGVIVAAPTAGSCGVLGGALFGSIEKDKFNLRDMAKAFLAAGLTGVFIADKYTFSAEEGGCQVEAGAGSAMAAAGLVELNGGTAKQGLDAASLALQNQLGLICDPVAVRVEIPCLGKNIMAATNAYNSFIMITAGFDAVIPYDEVIDAMKSVGNALPSSLCCTGKGGLAQTPTAMCLHKKLINAENN